MEFSCESIQLEKCLMRPLIADLFRLKTEICKHTLSVLFACYLSKRLKREVNHHRKKRNNSHLRTANTMAINCENLILKDTNLI